MGAVACTCKWLSSYHPACFWRVCYGANIGKAPDVSTAYESLQGTSADARIGQCNEGVPIHCMRSRPMQVTFLEAASSGMRDAVRAADEAADAAWGQLEERGRELLRQGAEAGALQQALIAAAEDQAQYMSMVASSSAYNAMRPLQLT